MTSSQTSPPNLSVVDPRTLGLPNVAFIGKAGAGKTTAAELLVELGYTKHSFAAPLKQIALDLWGQGADTDREKLQRLGVAVREIEPDTWVNLLIGRIRAPSGSFGQVWGKDHPIVVDDCRFPNEVEALQAEGFAIVRILAPRSTRIDRLKGNGKWQSEDQLDHISETALTDRLSAYHVENDGTRNDLYDALVDVLVKEQHKR